MKAPTRRFARPLEALAIGLAVAALVFAAERAGLLVRLELAAYDAALRLRAAAGAPDDRIVMIEVTESAIERYGHPLSDALLAESLETLTEMGARSVGVDIFRDRPVAPGSARLEAAFGSHPGIAIIEKLGGAEADGVAPPAWLAGGPQVGFADLVGDHDGTIRRGLLYLWDEDGNAHVALALRLALAYLAQEGVALGAAADDPSAIALGGTALPAFDGESGGYVGADDGGYQVLLDYRAPVGSFTRFELEALLAGQVPEDAVRDRIVILGTAAASVKDDVRAPLPGEHGPWLYGMEIHARAASQLLRHALDGQAPTRAPGVRAGAAWLAAWALLAAGLALALRSGVGRALAVLAGLAAIGACFGFALLADWWIPVAAPALGFATSAGLASSLASWRERREKSMISLLFARHVQRDVFDSIWQNRDEFLAGGRPRPKRLTVTIMMTDLEGYTSASEQMDPVGLMDWINEYMDAMAGLIEAHGGVVDDYAGDGIKANFGVPFPREGEAEIDADACTAVDAALAMFAEMERLNASWRERGLPTGRTRIGLYTGPAVVGSLGSAGRLKYTTVGDSVNTAARLESFDKEGYESDPAPCRILVGESTFERLRGRYRAEPIGAQKLKGKQEKIRVYRVYGRAGSDLEEAA